MTSEQRQRILEKLAWNVGEIYRANGIQTSNEFNWKKAEEALALDQKINGEDFLLVMLEEEKVDEDNLEQK